MSSSWRPGLGPAARGSWRLPAALAFLMAGSASAWASPCGNLRLSFLDNTPEQTLTIAPDEAPLRVSGQMQLSFDGSRDMQSRYWTVGYRVLPTGADAHGIAGESYWATGAKSPMLDIEFQRDGRGQITREILRSPPPPPASSPAAPWRILGWYEYLRGDQGQLRRLVYHFHSNPEAQLPSDDDPVQSIVVIDYGLGGRNPREAVIYGPIPRKGTGPRARIDFDYDSAGRLVGGTRQGLWPTYFQVTAGACEEVPERLFVILLGAHGGPWQLYDFGLYGAWPAGPR